MSVAVRLLLGLVATVLLSMVLSEGVGLGQRRAVSPSAEAGEVAPCRRDVAAVAGIGPIGFVAGSATLDPAAVPVIDAAARALVACAGVVTTVTAHTTAADAALSQRRAETVVGALVARGVPPARLVARGVGASAPVTAASGSDADRRNARVTFDLRPATNAVPAAAAAAMPAFLAVLIPSLGALLLGWLAAWLIWGLGAVRPAREG